jgi:hypothetical protein
MISHRNCGLVPSLLLGASVMLACQSKYTGLLMPATVCITYGVFFVRNTMSRKGLLSSFLIEAALALVPIGTFYFRNYLHYGTDQIGSAIINRPLALVAVAFLALLEACTNLFYWLARHDTPVGT